VELSYISSLGYYVFTHTLLHLIVTSQLIVASNTYINLGESVLHLGQYAVTPIIVTYGLISVYASVCVTAN
jgi:hypothetical protein